MTALGTTAASSGPFRPSAAAGRYHRRPGWRSRWLRPVLVLAAVAVAGRIAVCAAATAVGVGVHDGLTPQRPFAQAAAVMRGPASPSAARLCPGGPGGELIGSAAADDCLRATSVP